MRDRYYLEKEARRGVDYMAVLATVALAGLLALLSVVRHAGTIYPEELGPSDLDRAAIVATWDIENSADFWRMKQEFLTLESADVWTPPQVRRRGLATTP